MTTSPTRLEWPGERCSEVGGSVRSDSPGTHTRRASGGVEHIRNYSGDTRLHGDIRFVFAGVSIPKRHTMSQQANSGNQTAIHPAIVLCTPETGDSFRWESWLW